MHKRVINIQLLDLAKNYPIVTVLGPRQSGKTTLVKNCFENKPYLNLEARDIQEIAVNDPRQFLSQYPNGAIFDEIQNAPDLLSYIQIIVDELDIKGHFILTGSHQLQLHQAITQSLAGRVALLTLLPLSIQELKMSNISFGLDELLLNGGYPRIYKDQLNPTIAYKNYFQTYIERDVRQIINVKNLALFQKFIKICAGRVGQILSFEGMANDVGISANTIKE